MTNLRMYLESALASVISSWVEKDIYAISFLVCANETYAGYATKSPISNGTLYQLQGSLNGTVGRFEWIIQNQQVTHRMFVPGGGINRIPIMP